MALICIISDYLFSDRSFRLDDKEISVVNGWQLWTNISVDSHWRITPLSTPLSLLWSENICRRSWNVHISYRLLASFPNLETTACYCFLSQNRGIYMFRLDEDRVVDATLSGGLARYINHSCNPNCVAEIVEVERDLRIIIFAKRRISRGEEVSTIVENKSLYIIV